MTSEPNQYTGLLIIGDPHLESRTPGFRKDEYPQVILDKLAWCVRYAQAHRLLPTILGDLFDKPRDNPTWLLGRLIDMFADVECVGIYGNHDCADPQLKDDDSLSLLVKSGRIRLLDSAPWRGAMNGKPVVVGGSSYRCPIPELFVAGTTEGVLPLVFWLTHHDIIVPGYEEQGRLQPRDIPGIDMVINGHIHRHLEDVRKGGTLWITPGNISRRSRSDATKDHCPSVLRINIHAPHNSGEETPTDAFTRLVVEVPHEAFDNVFHSSIVEAVATEESESTFVAGLKELQSRATESGAGLITFLEKNMSQFEQPVVNEIMKLAQETISHDKK